MPALVVVNDQRRRDGERVHEKHDTQHRELPLILDLLVGELTALPRLRSVSSGNQIMCLNCNFRIMGEGGGHTHACGVFLGSLRSMGGRRGCVGAV